MRGAAVALWIVLAVAAVYLPAPVAAVPAGNFDLASAALSLNSSGVDFFPPGTGSGSFDVGPTASGVFAGLSGTAGSVKDLSFATIGMPIAVPNFLTLASLPAVDLNLGLISAGVFGSFLCGVAPAAGQVCTPSGSPLNFINLATAGGLSAVVSFSVNGTSAQLTPPRTFTVTFTAQFTGVSYQAVLATIAGGGSVSGPFAADVQLAGGTGGFGIGTTALSFLATGIDFLPAGGANGSAVIGPLTSGSFAGLFLTMASIKDVSYATAPVGMPILLPNFVTFAALPTMLLDLTLIRSGLFGTAQCALAPAVGQTCTPPGSAFNLVNLPDGTGGISSAAFFATDTVGDDGAGEAPLGGVFGVPLAAQSYQTLLTTLIASGSATRSYSAGFLAGPPLLPTPTTTPTATPSATPTITPSASPSASPTHTVPVGNGAPCTVPSQCVSGFCVDAVCCDRVCDQPFESCARPDAAGICGPITAPVPAASTSGIALAAGALLLIAAIALRRRRRLARDA